VLYAAETGTGIRAGLGTAFADEPTPIPERMCGIGGKLSFGSRPDSRVGEAMNETMSRRGPDDSGVYASGPVVLAHRRLSVLDLSDAGHQPMASDDGSVRVVFNGEIYNYRELKANHLSGERFRSETDTEVLLRLYEEYGVDCIPMLRGMFAFGIWDEEKDQLLLARDRLGQKPLYIRRGEDAFHFGSTIRSILADSDVEASPDLDAIRRYLTYQYVPRTATGFEGIERLHPGEYMLVEEDGIRRERYWELSYADQSDLSPASLADRLRERLRRATEIRMRSDVPVGVFLSGGVDSSVIALLMDEVTDNPIETYSVGFDVEGYDELEFARTVADACESNHHEYVVTPDAAEVLPELVEQYEMPFGDASALPTYYVSQVAAEDVTVALTGDAGDENFAGYDRYTFDRLSTQVGRLPAPLLGAVRAGVDALPEPLRETRRARHARRFLRSAESGPVERFAQFTCYSMDAESDPVWDGPVPEDDFEQLRAAFAGSDGPTRMDRVMDVDIGTYLPDDLLVKVDRASMAHSLELRSPFLDHEVVEFAARIPAKYKWRRGNKKWLLKRAFSETLPDKIRTREKQGFGVPLDEWFRGELREPVRPALERLGTRNGFDRAGVTGLLEDHVAGHADNGYRLWHLMMLDQWYERFIEAEAEPPQAPVL